MSEAFRARLRRLRREDAPRGDAGGAAPDRSGRRGAGATSEGPVGEGPTDAGPIAAGPMAEGPGLEGPGLEGPGLEEPGAGATRADEPSTREPLAAEPADRRGPSGTGRNARTAVVGRPGTARPDADARPAPQGAPGGPELPVWLRARLGRGARPAAAVGTSVGPPAGLEPLPAGGAERVARFPLDHRHGAWPLGAALDVERDVLALVAHDPGLAALDPARAVYLDIETTGLSGGAGTWPFLVALGRFTGDRFELWQGFMAGPEDEPAVLDEVARRVEDAGALVTFFGKSFDRHRLEDKMRVCGVRPPFAGLPHLDLYHACRRLYGDAQPDGRLQTMERALCGVERADDLPGSFAPAAWFDFIAGRAHRLEDVFRHNLDDVLSLATLTAHLGRSVDERGPDGGPLAGHPVTRARALARAHERRREHARAAHWHAVAADRAEGASLVGTAREARFEAARALERAGEPDAARALHESVATGDDAVAARALERLALLDERRGAFDSAAERAGRGLELARRRLPGGDRDPLARALARRLARLEARR